MSDKRFPKSARLLRTSEFQRVFDARNSAADAWIVLYGAKSELAQPRLGLTVSRRVGGAVARNRWKRLLREAFRMSRSDIAPLDLVCVVRGQVPPTLAQMRNSLIALSKRLQKRLDHRVNMGGAGR